MSASLLVCIGVVWFLGGFWVVFLLFFFWGGGLLLVCVGFVLCFCFCFFLYK